MAHCAVWKTHTQSTFLIGRKRFVLGARGQPGSASVVSSMSDCPLVMDLSAWAVATFTTSVISYLIASVTVSRSMWLCLITTRTICAFLLAFIADPGLSMQPDCRKFVAFISLASPLPT